MFVEDWAIALVTFSSVFYLSSNALEKSYWFSNDWGTKTTAQLRGSMSSLFLVTSIKKDMKTAYAQFLFKNLVVAVRL